MCCKCALVKRVAVLAQGAALSECDYLFKCIFVQGGMAEGARFSATPTVQYIHSDPLIGLFDCRNLVSCN